MKYFTLYTGGKDSTMATILAAEEGIPVDALVVIKPRNPESYMFHSINLEWTLLQSISQGIPIYYFNSSGVKEEELKDLKEAFECMKEKGFIGVVVGAIASRYQYNRVNKIAKKVGLNVYAPLWNADQDTLLKMYLDKGIKYMIISVSAAGLDKKHLGWIISSGGDIKKLIQIARKYGFNPTGEGGEYETFVLDAPIFKYRIEIVKYSIKWFGDSGYLKIEDARLIPKGDSIE